MHILSHKNLKIETKKESKNVFIFHHNAGVWNSRLCFSWLSKILNKNQQIIIISYHIKKLKKNRSKHSEFSNVFGSILKKLVEKNFVKILFKNEKNESKKMKIKTKNLFMMCSSLGCSSALTAMKNIKEEGIKIKNIPKIFVNPILGDSNGTKSLQLYGRGLWVSKYGLLKLLSLHYGLNLDQESRSLLFPLKFNETQIFSSPSLFFLSEFDINLDDSLHFASKFSSKGKVVILQRTPHNVPYLDYFFDEQFEIISKNIQKFLSFYK